MEIKSFKTGGSRTINIVECRDDYMKVVAEMEFELNEGTDNIEADFDKAVELQLKLLSKQAKAIFNKIKKSR